MVISKLSKTSAFFQPQAPPPPLPQPLLQTSLFYATPPFTLMCQEAIMPNIPRKLYFGKVTHCPASDDTSTRKKHSDCQASKDNDNSSSESVDETDQDHPMDSDTDPDDDCIPKPEGEPGCPNRGGYNLREAVNLDEKTYRKLKVRYMLLLCGFLANESSGTY